MTVQQLILDLDVAGLAAEVRFNDVVIARERTGEPVRRAVRLGAWAVEGANPLSVDLGALPPPPPREDGRPSAPPRFSLLLRRTLGEAEQVLARYDWTPEIPLPPGGGRARLFAQPVPFSPPAVWRWLRADSIPALSSADRTAIEQLLQRLHQALAAKDPAPLLDAQSIQVGEHAIAAGEAPESFIASYASFLGERMGEVSWRVEPLAPLTIETMAGGRVHHVAGPGGGPPLVARTAESVFAIDPYVARVDGQWRVVR